MSAERWEQEIRKATCEGCRMEIQLIKNNKHYHEDSEACTYNPALLSIVQKAYEAGYAEGQRYPVDAEGHSREVANRANIELQALIAQAMKAYAEGERAMRERAAKECEYPSTIITWYQCAAAIRALPVEAAPATPTITVSQGALPGTVSSLESGPTTRCIECGQLTWATGNGICPTCDGGKNISASGGPGAPSEAGDK